METKTRERADNSSSFKSERRAFVRRMLKAFALATPMLFLNKIWAAPTAPLSEHHPTDSEDSDIFSDRLSSYVVTAPCVSCKYTDCAAVCPVEAFHQLPDRLYINPETCIDCDSCVPECPVEAIFSADTVPAKYRKWIALNKQAKHYPVISQKKRALHRKSCKGPVERT